MLSSSGSEPPRGELVNSARIPHNTGVNSPTKQERCTVSDSSLTPNFADQIKPASFYLGLEYDLASKSTHPKPIHYESKDLVTHGVVVGMTGSGKTGLSIALLEEAAIDGIPCIIIDP